MSALEKFNYDTCTYGPLPGTEDWVSVADLGEGGYDWIEFKAFYSPNARRYFWHGDRGCSCNSWSDELRDATDLQNGSRADLLRAWETFTKDQGQYSLTVTDYLHGVAEIKKFEPEL